MENNNQSWLSFLLTKTFYKNLSLSLAFVVLIIITILIALRFYTRHDDLIELPNFNGLDIQKVDSILVEKSLRYIIIDSVFNSELPPLSIIDQDPIAGSFVKEDRRILLNNCCQKEETSSNTSSSRLVTEKSSFKIKSIRIRGRKFVICSRYGKKCSLKTAFER